MARVCIVRQSYFPEEAHVRKHVDALSDAGYAVDVVCLRAPGERAHETYRGGTVKRLPLTHRRGGRLRYLFEYALFFVLTWMLLTYRSLRRRYDIVEVYNLPDALVFAALPAKLLGSKMVFYMFELMPEQAADEWRLDSHAALPRLLRRIERAAVHLADRVVTVSPYDKQVVVERDAPRREPAVVLNVPEDALFAPNGTKPSSERFRLITHGALLRRYGVQTLLRALPYLDEWVPELEVCVLGDGEYRRELEALARRLGVEERVTFPGWVAHEDVPEAIGRADVGVVPAPVPWLLPNKLFEYVAMGTPVIAAASPSLSAVFPDDALAYFWPDDPRDLARRVVELHADRARARGMAAAALRAYQAYRWATMRDVYVGLHDELLAARARPARAKEEPA